MLDSATEFAISVSLAEIKFFRYRAMPKLAPEFESIAFSKKSHYLDSPFANST
jgi:hypothetical protein